MQNELEPWWHAALGVLCLPIVVLGFFAVIMIAMELAK